MIRAVPKDRLLIHDSKEGYGPLCEFLGVPVPEEPYPKTNSKEYRLKQMAKWTRRVYFTLFAVPTVAIAVGIGAWCLFRQCC